MKEKLKKFGTFCGRVACTIVGLAIAGYGISYFVPKKQYSYGEVSVNDISSTNKEEEEH